MGRHDYHGASIAALCSLAEMRGYRLVHCDLSGVNAFFIRTDLPGDYPKDVLVRGPNRYLLGCAHPPDPQNRKFVKLG